MNIILDAGAAFKCFKIYQDALKNAQITEVAASILLVLEDKGRVSYAFAMQKANPMKDAYVARKIKEAFDALISKGYVYRFMAVDQKVPEKFEITPAGRVIIDKISSQILTLYQRQ